MRIILLILLAMSPNAFAEKFSSFDTLVGEELMVDNGWAGESFTLKRKDKKFVICHTIFGSGVPIVSKTSYPVSQLGEHKIGFSIAPAKVSNKFEFTFSLTQDGELEIFHEGYKLAPYKVLKK